MFQCKYNAKRFKQKQKKFQKIKNTQQWKIDNEWILFTRFRYNFHFFYFIFYGWVTLCWNNEIYLINRLWGTPSIGTIWVYKIQRFTFSIRTRIRRSYVYVFMFSTANRKKHMYRYIYTRWERTLLLLFRNEKKTKSF